jgi:hypothetical protein
VANLPTSDGTTPLMAAAGCRAPLLRDQRTRADPQPVAEGGKLLIEAGVT